MIKLKWLSLAIATCLLCTVIFSPSAIIQAQEPTAALSEGCAELNTLDYVFTGPSSQTTLQYAGSAEFIAGETITWSIRLDGFTGVLQLAIFDELTGDFQAPEIFVNEMGSIITVSGSYVVPESGEYGVAINLLVTLPNAAVVDVNCFGAPLPGIDDRINYGYGDLLTIGYSPFVDGEPQLVIYCRDVTTDTNTLGFVVTHDDVVDLVPSDTPQLIASVYNGTCEAEFYLLPSNEYQLVIYAPEGKRYDLIDDDLNFRDSTRTYFDPNE